MSIINTIHSYIRRPQNVRVEQNFSNLKHKEYRRMPVLKLPPPADTLVPLHIALQKRSSFHKDESLDSPISLSDLSTLLWHSLSKNITKDRRPYPSAGALYPIESYLLGNIEGEKDNFVFHYNPTNHSLEKLWSLSDDDMSDLSVSSVTPTSRLFLVFSAVWQRSSSTYGDLAYSHSLIEAGHMAQNILLVATSLNLKGRPVAGFNDDLLIKVLDLDQTKEQPVYGVFLSS